MEIVLIVMLVVGVLVSMIIGIPMRKHLLAETEIKKIGLFQVPFYLKDYQKMLSEKEPGSVKRKYRTYLLIFLLSNLVFVIAALALLLRP